MDEATDGYDGTFFTVRVAGIAEHPFLNSVSIYLSVGVDRSRLIAPFAEGVCWSELGHDYSPALSVLMAVMARAARARVNTASNPMRVGNGMFSAHIAAKDWELFKAKVMPARTVM